MTQAVHPASSSGLLKSKATVIELRTNPAKAARLPALDFTKGALVLIMVLYHWLNYFIGFDWPYYRYLRFLTPSFIFVTGFLISTVYLSKSWNPSLSKRLLVRALKLLGVFAVLNTARFFLIPVSDHMVAEISQLTAKDIVAIFVTGNIFSDAVGKLAAFYILVPISYLLILSAAMIPLYRRWRYAFHALCVFCLADILVLYLIGYDCPNLEVIAIGLVGVLLGFVSIEKVNNIVSHPIVLGFTYVLYVTAITIWNAKFPLLVVGVCLSLALIYLLGRSDDDPGLVRNHILLLGRYSLFGYISQIAILQTLSAVLRPIHLRHLLQVVSFVASFVMTMVAVEVIDRLRAKSMLVDSAYRAVFA
jgi:hypothetical protein